MSALRIAILGDGLIGRMASAALARRGVAVTVVGTGARDHGLGPVGEAVTLSPDWLASDIGGIVPLDWLARHGRLSWSLGNAFTGWGRNAAPWFMPCGEAGAPLGTTPFHQLVARARHAGHSVRIADHALAAIAAQVERFAFPSDDRRSPRSTLALAAHVDANALAAGFARAGEAMGVRHATRFAAASVEGVRIVALTLDDGSRIAADFFVDCSDDGHLVDPSGDGDWTDWRDRFPFDRVRVVRESDTAPPPYALVAAHEDGWRASVPLPDGRIVTEFSSAATAAADATDFAPGMRAQPWRGNCIGIGSSVCRIDPLFGAPLMLASRAVERLTGLLPGSGDASIERAEYNRLSVQAAERAADTVQALYVSNGRAGDESWDRARAAGRSPLLDAKLALYASRGVVRLDDGELFEAEDWVSLLDGQGIHPRRHDPLASAHSVEAIDAHLARIRARLIDEVRAMPTHAAVLNARN